MFEPDVDPDSSGSTLSVVKIFVPTLGFSSPRGLSSWGSLSDVYMLYVVHVSGKDRIYHRVVFETGRETK